MEQSKRIGRRVVVILFLSLLLSLVVFSVPAQAYTEPSITRISLTKTTAYVGDSITATIYTSGGSGMRLYHFALFDYNTDEMIFIKENSTSNSWTFSIPRPGAFVVVGIYEDDYYYAPGSSAVIAASARPALTITKPTRYGDVPSGRTVATSATASGGTGNYSYQFQLLNTSGAVVLQSSFSGASSWSFVAPSEGAYAIRAVVMDGSTWTSSTCDWFYVYSNPITIHAVNSPGNVMSGSKVTASTYASGGTGSFSYQFQLLNTSGVAVMNSGGPSNASSWSFTAPSEGAYAVLAIVMDGQTWTYAASDWFYVSAPQAPLSIGKPSWPGNAASGSWVATSVTASGGTGNYTYQYQLLNSSGVVVQQTGVTSSRSWAFAAPAVEGGYAVVAIVMDGQNWTYAAGDWFYVYVPRDAVPETIIETPTDAESLDVILPTDDPITPTQEPAATDTPMPTDLAPTDTPIPTEPAATDAPVPTDPVATDTPAPTDPAPESSTESPAPTKDSESDPTPLPQTQEPADDPAA